MKLAIMGAGQVGESLARATLAAGYEVMLSSRTPRSERMQKLSAALGDNAQIGSVEETLAFSDVVALALGYDAALDVAKTAGDWSGKVILDMTQGDMTQLAMLTETHVVKIFNSIGAEHYQNPDFNGQAASMFYCGDDADAKATAAKIATDIGFEALDAGDSSIGSDLVNMARFWVALMGNGYGRNIAFKLIHK